ncbi:MAG: NTP transferase domain-containing protein, partial [Oscillospiraceae bacterium]|nr:NTP transferase domain-containing protein [Oscillospiraceae bacterium]
KPMAKLCGKPVLEHILALLRRCGVRRACIALRYRPEVIRDYFGDGKRFGLELEYHIERAELGTAGCVRACRDFYGDEDFLVISGDCACDFDLEQLMEAHRQRRPAVTMALASHETPLQYGTVLTNRDGSVVSFIEKPAWERVVSDLVNTGIYVLSPGAMEFVPTDGRAWDFAKDLFPTLLAAGQTILGIQMEGYWCDIGTPRSYYQCNLDALEGRLRLEGVQPPTAPAQGSKPIAAGARVELRCRSRARIMRELSQSLMEAGADFSDGLLLRSPGGSVRIAPVADREALSITAEAPDPAKSGALAENYANMIRKMER